MSFTVAHTSFQSILKEPWLKPGPGNRIASHVLFWLTYYLFVSVILCWGLYNIADPYFYFRLLLFFPISAGIVYFNLYFLVPKFLYKRRYFIYGSLLIVAVFIASVLSVLLRKAYLQAGYSIYLQVASFHYKVILSESLNELYLVTITTGIKVTKNWLELKQLHYEREKKLLQTELNFLKSQIHPHFFFNTLNNLYALTLSKSDLASDVVLRLSSLMRYLLYESDVPRVALSKEVEYLENFIELEKLRFGKRVKIVYKVSGCIDQIEVAPYILLLFVENSFKHGARNNLDSVVISISLRIEDAFIDFQVSNPVSAGPLKTGDSGIGLKNVKRRLELLYGDRFNLEITNDKEYFVHLKLPAE